MILRMNMSERERELGRIRNCCIILSGEFALSHISNKLQLLPTHLVTLIHLKFHMRHCGVRVTTTTT